VFLRCVIRNINGASADEGVTFIPIPVALWSKAKMCSRLTAGIAGSRVRGFAGSRVRGICSSLVLVVCCVGSGHSNGLITRSDESYRVCLVNCVRSTNLPTNSYSAYVRTI
jgi:hypothetical protein